MTGLTDCKILSRICKEGLKNKKITLDRAASIACEHERMVISAPRCLIHRMSCEFLYGCVAFSITSFQYVWYSL